MQTFFVIVAALLLLPFSGVMAQTYSDTGSGSTVDDVGFGSSLDDVGYGSTNNGSGNTVALQNPLAADNILELFQTIIDIALVFAIPLIVFFIIYAGFMYVTARGNQGTIEKAHKALLYALVGGLLILGANVLIQVIQGTVDCVRDLDGECSS